MNQNDPYISPERVIEALPTYEGGRLTILPEVQSRRQERRALTERAMQVRFARAEAMYQRGDLIKDFNREQQTLVDVSGAPGAEDYNRRVQDVFRRKPRDLQAEKDLVMEKFRQIDELNLQEMMKMSDAEVVENFAMLDTLQKIAGEVEKFQSTYKDVLSPQEMETLVRVQDKSPQLTGLLNRIDFIANPYYEALTVEQLEFCDFTEMWENLGIDESAEYKNHPLYMLEGDASFWSDMTHNAQKIMLAEQGVDISKDTFQKLDGTRALGHEATYYIRKGFPVMAQGADGVSRVLFPGDSPMEAHAVDPGTVEERTNEVKEEIVANSEDLNGLLETVDRHVLFGSKQFKTMQKLMKELQTKTTALDGVSSPEAAMGAMKLLKELSDASKSYLHYKAETGKKGLEGKNQTEKDRIAAARDIQTFANDNLNRLRDMLGLEPVEEYGMENDGPLAQQTDFVPLGRDYRKVKCPASDLGSGLENLRLDVVQGMQTLAMYTNPAFAGVGGANGLQQNMAGVKQILAEAVLLEIILAERGGQLENVQAGIMERLLVTSGKEKVLESVQEHPEFQNAMKDMTPDRLRTFLSSNEAANLGRSIRYPQPTNRQQEIPNKVISTEANKQMGHNFGN